MYEAPFGLYRLKAALRPREVPEGVYLGSAAEVLAQLARLPGAAVQPGHSEVLRYPHMALGGGWLGRAAPRQSVVLEREGRGLSFDVVGDPVRCVGGPGVRELSCLARELGWVERMGIVDIKAKAWRPLDGAAAWGPAPAPATEAPAARPEAERAAAPDEALPVGPLRPRWSRTLEAMGGLGGTLEALVPTPVAVLACGEERLLALRRDTGEPLWELRPGRFPLAVSTPACVVVASNPLLGVSHETGAELWRLPCEARAYHAPEPLGGDRVAVALGPGLLGVLDSREGRLLWSRRFSGSHQPLARFHAGTLLAALPEEGVHVLDPETGETRAHHTLREVLRDEGGRLSFQGLEVEGDSVFVREGYALIRLRLPTLALEEVVRLQPFRASPALRRLGGLLAVAGTPERTPEQVAEEDRQLQALKRRLRREYLREVRGPRLYLREKRRLRLDAHDEAELQHRFNHASVDILLAARDVLRLYAPGPLMLLAEFTPPDTWRLPVAVDARHALLPVRTESVAKVPALQLLRLDSFEVVELPLPGAPRIPLVLAADGAGAVFLARGPTVTAYALEG